MNQIQQGYNQGSPINMGGLQSQMVPHVSAAKSLRVPSAIGHLEHSLEQLQKTVEVLETRLDSIIRHEPTNPCPQAAPQLAPPQMVYERLESLSERFNRVNDRLTNILQVLEV